ncbi:MAG TPA: GNAT family N-acetyltransferase [Blastocatellia bacterium]|nr:GNAT family N-acetyltransferase [Blastocatellia bacterium]
MYEWQAQARRFHISEASREAEYHVIEEMQKEVWGFNDLDAIPMAHLVAAQHAGGMVLCAYEGTRMIGFAYGFPAHEGGRSSIHSHMLAVMPDCRNLQVGFHLKLAQRERALESGLDEITWTFDPLQSLNAHLNVGKLGVISDRYIVNFYGEATSSPLHQGFGTDRLWVRWLLESENVRQRLRGGARRGSHDVAATLRGPHLVLADGDQPRLGDLDGGVQADRCFIGIPYNINLLKERDRELGAAWRSITRRAFLAALDAGFMIQDFLVARDQETVGGLYVLVK